VIEGVEIIYADLATLIAGKETYRDQDRVDVFPPARIAAT
jgi:hypothetical protein